MVRSWLLPSLAVLAAVILPGSEVRAQPVDDIRWVPNGPVYAVARHDGITYVGGQFTIVSPPGGGGAPINIANDVIPAGYPYVVGRVFAVAPDGLGGWYIGGLFTHVGGQPRNNIARIAADYSVYAWNPNANGAVLALATPTSGTIYVGGEFTSIGGQSRTRLAELDANTGLATSMNIEMSSVVRALGNAGTTMYVGGDFTFAGVTPRSRLCAINMATRTLTTWNPGASGTVHALEVVSRPGPSISILVGGSFGTLAGQARANLGEVFTTGLASSWNPSPNGTVRDIHEQAVDYIGGDFTTVGGQPRNHVAAVDPNGFIYPWNPDVDGPVETLTWSSNHVFVGGTFANVGGLPRRNAAKIDQTTGIAAAWDPKPNNTVKALVVGTGKIYAGGEFTGFGGVERRNLAAFDDWTARPTSWDPSPDGTVLALALRSFGPAVYAVYAGGAFLNVQGQPRAHLAAIHPKTGAPTSWVTDTNLLVRALAVNDTLVAFGGDFTSTNGEATGFVAARLHTGGPVIHFDGLPGGSIVQALALNASTLHVGGTFGFARFNRPTQSLIAYQNPTTNGNVIALLARGNTIYAGGSFTTVGGQPRSRLVKLTNNSTLDAWNPGADGIVRALVQGETGLVAGGDFLNAGGAPRQRIALIDQTTGLALPWGADITDREVWALSARGPVVDVGGTFRGVASLSPLAGYGVLGLNRISLCGAPLASTAGGRPRALAVLDYNADGIEDLAVCQDGGATKRVDIMRGTGSGGVGNGLFAMVQNLILSSTPQAVVAADFDKDGLPDLAVSESDESGVITLFHNVSGTFQPWTSVPLMGRSDGLAAGDFDADGILDLVACLVDSAGTIKRGGLQFFRGGGPNGTWDGTFVYSDKSHQLVWAASARRVVAHDFDQDGFADYFVTGATSVPLLVFTGPTLEVTCQQVVSDFPYPPDGFAVAHGDFNEDGRSDLVYSRGRSLNIRYKNETVGCGIWFPLPNQISVALPSTPKDLAVMDVDRDGILDVLCTFDSLSTLAYCRGGGADGIPDGTILPPVDLISHDVWAIALGDFVTDEDTDILTTMATCGYVSVLQGTALPMFPMTITLDSPNGGESLARTPVTRPPLETLSLEIAEDELAVMSSSSDAAPPARVASLRTISWTKGAGVHGVDVELSRNDGTTWESIATNMPGSSMTWYSTPPAASLARVRVRDAVFRAHIDASDAPFAVITGLIGTPPPGAPAVAGLALLGRNPSLGAMRFRLDVPQAADVTVVVYDAAGRAVRTLARRAYPAGSHDVGWDGADERGAGARRGVYFVKTTIGSFRATRKVVML